MTDNATPKRAPRPIRYPAAIPRTMTTTAQREAIDATAERDDVGLATAIRDLVADGLVLHAAYSHDPSVRGAVHRMASDAGVTEAEAVATMLGFAVRESERRLRRNEAIAHEVGAGLGEMGFSVDGVSIGGLDLNARG